MFNMRTACDTAHVKSVRMLNICKTFHGIHVPLNFLFKLTGINLIQLNINPVEFHLIRLRSFCNIYMSNDVKLFLNTLILLTCRKATEALIHKASNYPHLLPEIPRYCCPHEILHFGFSVLSRYD